MNGTPIHATAADALADPALGAKRLATLSEADKMVGRRAVTVSGRVGVYAQPLRDADGAFVVGVALQGDPQA